MTIEYEHLETGERRLADYRTFEDKNEPYVTRMILPESPILIYDSMPDIDNFGGSEFVFAYPVDPDTFELKKIYTGNFGQIPSVEVIATISREAINLLAIKDDKVKAIWHETKPDDYPPPPVGFTIVENP